MCRWVAYNGKPVFLSELVTAPANSLIVQSHAAQECKTRVNGDGFGLSWYGEQPEPGLYRDVLPAWSDCNLRSLARQIRSPLFMAHIRASTGSATSRQNCHPFACGRWTFMHNGQIGGFDKIRRRLEGHLDEFHYSQHQGSTDSELLFLLMMQNGIEDDPRQAMCRALSIVMAEGRNAGFDPLIRATAALSDGDTLYAFRTSSDETCPPLYRGDYAGMGVCLVSEPFERETGNWHEIPPGSFVRIAKGRMEVTPLFLSKAA